MIHRLIPALLAASMLAACGEQAPPPHETMVVKTVVIGTATSDPARSYSGEVHARYEIPLSFRIGGKLVERKVDAGAHVTARQLLARLDPADVALQAAQAQSQLTLAQADAKRYRDLRSQNFVSTAALDTKETALQAAESQAGIARNQSGYAQLTADRPGIIAAVLAEPGQVVAAGQPILRIAQDGEREILIALPESVVTTLKVGDEATVALWSGGKNYRGRLRELAPAADSTTRTFPARVALLDADAAVVLGMTATVRFATANGPAMTIPLSAVFQQGDRPAVWVVGQDATLTLRPVTVTAYTDAGAAIGGGIQDGERIVAAGVHKLAAGQKVRVAQ
jgi:multidrug efflux system membrane fusion protein